MVVLVVICVLVVGGLFCGVVWVWWCDVVCYFSFNVGVVEVVFVGVFDVWLGGFIWYYYELQIWFILGDGWLFKVVDLCCVVVLLWVVQVGVVVLVVMLVYCWWLQWLVSFCLIVIGLFGGGDFVFFWWCVWILVQVKQFKLIGVRMLNEIYWMLQDRNGLGFRCGMLSMLSLLGWFLINCRQDLVSWILVSVVICLVLIEYICWKLFLMNGFLFVMFGLELCSCVVMVIVCIGRWGIGGMCEFIWGCMYLWLIRMVGLLLIMNGVNILNVWFFFIMCSWVSICMFGRYCLVVVIWCYCVFGVDEFCCGRRVFSGIGGVLREYLICWFFCDVLVFLFSCYGVSIVKYRQVNVIMIRVNVSQLGCSRNVRWGINLVCFV